MGTRLQFRAAAYFRWQHAPLSQQEEPLQQSAFADLAKEVPNVSITRAARLNTRMASFFIEILLIKVFKHGHRHWRRNTERPTRKQVAVGLF